MSRLLSQIKEALAFFVSLKTSPALIASASSVRKGSLPSNCRATSTTRRGSAISTTSALFKANAGQLDMDEVRRYFVLFDREDLLEALKDGR